MRLNEIEKLNISEKLNEWISNPGSDKWEKMGKEMNELLEQWDGEGTHPFIEIIEENDRVILG